MFNLETALSTWRHYFAQRRGIQKEDLDELERHVRDHVRYAVEQGNSEEEAFWEAVREVGDYDGAEEEYRKVYWGKVKRNRLFNNELSWRVAMLKSYFTIAVRNLQRQQTHALINIAGLALGLAVCFLITLFVYDELSYDRFHEKADRIYRVVESYTHNDISRQNLIHSAPLAPALVNDLPEIESAVRLSNRWGEVLVSRDTEAFYEDGFFFTDTSFFDVFTFPLVQGSPSSLAKPFTVIITESVAEKYFGDEDPVGQKVEIKGSWGTYEYEITGIARDVPHNSHFHFQFLTSLETLRATRPKPEHMESWWYVEYYTYVLLQPGHQVEDLQAKFPAFISKYKGERLKQIDVHSAYELQPIADIHLYSHLEREIEPNSDARYLYIFSVLALLILAVACINYMNLSTARSAMRASEVGVRKVVGAHRTQLIRQFLFESLVLSGMALVLAFLLIALLLPLFNHLTGKSLSVTYLGHGDLVLGLIGAGLFVGLLAGSYPALFLSRFQPVHVLKGLLGMGPASTLFRKGLVVFQFIISIGLVVGTIVIQRQLTYMQNKQLGLHAEQVVVINTHGEIGRRLPAFRSDLLKYPGILNVSASDQAFPVREFVMGLRPEGFEETDVQAKLINVAPHFLETLDIPLLQGDNLPEMYEPAEREYQPVLVNEAAVKQFGWDDPIGKTFTCCVAPTPRVVGVVSDFHYQSLKEEIAPLVLMPTWWSQQVLVRIRAENIFATLDQIEDAWAAFVPGEPFEYTFLDSRFEQIYQAEERFMQIFGAFSFLAIILVCLGLFGLAAFMAERRTKEIGIRKVLGASAPSIVTLLSKDFLKLVLIAFVLAAPLAYLAMSRWLEDFAYRIELGPGIFLLAGGLALLIALATVSYQAVKAALADPVKSLRYE